MEENSMYDKLLLLPLFQRPLQRRLYKHIGKSKTAFSEIPYRALYRQTRRRLQQPYLRLARQSAVRIDRQDTPLHALRNPERPACHRALFAIRHASAIQRFLFRFEQHPHRHNRQIVCAGGIKQIHHFPAQLREPALQPHPDVLPPHVEHTHRQHAGKKSSTSCSCGVPQPPAIKSFTPGWKTSPTCSTTHASTSRKC